MFGNNRSGANDYDATTQIIDFLRQMAQGQSIQLIKLQESVDGLQGEVEALKGQIADMRATLTAPVQVKEPVVVVADTHVQEAAAEVPHEETAAQVSNENFAQSVEIVEKETVVTAQNPSNNSAWPPLFYGPPEGGGFESADIIPGRDDPRALYELRRISETEAMFFPLSDRFHRLRSSASAFVLPVCSVSGNIGDATGISVQADGYGRLKLEDGYWALIQKCRVECK